MRYSILLAIGAMLVGWQMPAWAEVPIGQAVRAIEKVQASRDTKRRFVSKSDPVYANELIETGDNSYAGLTFRDKTTLAIGPNADVLLDEFVYDSNTNAGNMVLTITKGALRFISGALPKRAIRLRTPAGTVGIRGTGIAIFVDAAGPVTIFVPKGVGIFSNFAGQVILTLNAGQSVTFAPATPGAPATPTGPPGPLPPNLAAMLQGMTNVQPSSDSRSGAPPGAPAVVVVSVGNVSVSNMAAALAAAAQSPGAPAGVGAASKVAEGDVARIGGMTLGAAVILGIILLTDGDSTIRSARPL